MTHEHDFELILAIAEGALGPAEQAAAEALLAPCQVCRTDLQLQREALAALQAAPPVFMTASERASFHRTVAENLIPVPQKTHPQPNLPWFQRLMPAMAAAAALLVIVGVGSILVDRTAGTDAAAEATTTAAATNLDQADLREEAADTAGAAELDNGAGATTTAPALAASPVSVVEEYGSVSSADLADIAAQMKTSEPTDGGEGYPLDFLRSPAFEPSLVCADTANSAGRITAIGRATVDGDDVEIYRIDDLVKVYSTADCSLTNLFG